MDIEELRKEKREEILKLATKHGARNVRVFGSGARGEAGSGSDIDLLVDMEPGRSLLDLGGLWSDLNELLGSKVGVVTEQGILLALATPDPERSAAVMKDPRVYLAQILECIERIASYTAGGKEAFFSPLRRRRGGRGRRRTV